MKTKTKLLIRSVLGSSIIFCFFLVSLLKDKCDIWLFSATWLFCGLASITGLIFRGLPLSLGKVKYSFLLAIIGFFSTSGIAYFCGIDPENFYLYPVWLKSLRWLLFLTIVGFCIYHVYLDTKFSEIK